MSGEAFPCGKTVIVSTSTYGMGEAHGFAPADLAVHAGLAELAKVGLKPSDVDGLFGALSDDALSGLYLSEYLGIRPRITENTRTGGSSFEIHAGMAALEAGLCDVALISTEATGARPLES